MDKLLVLLCSLALVSLSRGTLTRHPCNTTSCPEYTLEEEHSTFQKRLYGDTRWLSTRVARRSTISIFSAVIQLKNFCKENDVQGMQDSWPGLLTIHSGENNSLSWFVPPGVTVPTPASNSSVTLEAQGPFRVYVRSFSGFPSMRSGRENAEALWEDLQTHLEKNCSIPTVSGASYSRVTSLEQHNEIWIRDADIC